MKVLHFMMSEKMGGIERFIINNWQEIELRGCDIEFFVVSNNNWEYIDSEKIKQNIVIIPPINRFISYIMKIIKILFINNYDIIHFHKNSLCNAIPIYLTKLLTNAKIVIHAHNTAPKGISGMYKYLHYINRRLIKYMKVTRVACSKEAAKYFFGNDIDDIRIIGNGIDLSAFVYDKSKREEIREKYKIPKEAVVVGDVAALIEQKNIKFLIDLIKELGDNYYLILVGDGDKRAELEKYADISGVGGRTFFAGAVNTVKDYLDAMDVFVMPSLFEGLPISAIEAQANGLPCILSDNIDQMVKISRNLTFLPINNIDRWTMVIQYSCRERKNELIPIVSDMFSIKSSVEHLIDIYK